MRAGYGEKLRNFFAEHTNPICLIDFAGQKVFESATVDVNILMFVKAKNEHNTVACIAKDACLNNLSVFVKQNKSSMSFSDGCSWTILSSIEQNIKRKIDLIGTPLREWDISINYGIKTGLNDAFIINGSKKDELIAADSKSAEIIRPILRGRDIKRYEYNFADLWIINVHNGLKEKGIPRITIEDYPAIKEHLHNYYDKLAIRADKGDTPYNLRNCAYMDDFSKQKIVWGNLCLSAQFALAEAGTYINAPSPMIVPGNKYLLAVLNSKLADWYIRQLGVTRNGGYFEYKPMFIEKLPIPKLATSQEKPFIDLVNKILDAHSSRLQSDYRYLEAQIDQLVFSIYGLTQQETDYILRTSL
jgi:hypothetical protein